MYSQMVTDAEQRLNRNFSRNRRLSVGTKCGDALGRFEFWEMRRIAENTRGRGRTHQRRYNAAILNEKAQ